VEEPGTGSGLLVGCTRLPPFFGLSMFVRVLTKLASEANFVFSVDIRGFGNGRPSLTFPAAHFGSVGFGSGLPSFDCDPLIFGLSPGTT